MHPGNLSKRQVDAGCRKHANVELAQQRGDPLLLVLASLLIPLEHLCLDLKDLLFGGGLVLLLSRIFIVIFASFGPLQRLLLIN